MQSLLLRPGLAKQVAICSVLLVAMAEGGATSGWQAILRGKKQLEEINKDLGILAPVLRRYWGKLWLRLVRRSSSLLLPKYKGD